MDLFYFRLLFLILSACGCCNGLHAPVISGEISGISGKNVTFKPAVKSIEVDTFLTISWGYQNTETNVVTSAANKLVIEPPYVGRVLMNTSNGELLFGPLTSTDSGIYTLRMVTNDVQTLSGSVKLTVLEPVSGVKIMSNVTEPVEFNSTLALTCSALGSGLSYQWKNGTAPLVADGTRVTFSNSSVLIVVGVLRNDLVGPIYCTAYNLEQATSAPFNLTVSYGPEMLTMGVNPFPGIQKKGSNVTFNCSAQSSPPATIEWYRNGVLLSKGPTLALPNIVEAQEGNYSCLAFNPKTLRYLASTPVTISVMAAISGANVTGLAATLVAGNGTGNLTCQASAGIVASTQWLKDLKALTPSNRVVFSPDSSSVVIAPLQKEDSGEYQCVLSNAVSTNSVSFKMQVYYGPEGVKVEGKHAVTEQGSITLTCFAQSHPPAAYTWKFNGTLIPVTTANNTITVATGQNTGTYTCIATNAITGKTMALDHTLVVKGQGVPLEDPEGMTGGQIAGIIIGVIIAMVIIGAVVMCLRKKKPIQESPY